MGRAIYPGPLPLVGAQPSQTLPSAEGYLHANSMGNSYLETVKREPSPQGGARRIEKSPASYWHVVG